MLLAKLLGAEDERKKTYAKIYVDKIAMLLEKKNIDVDYVANILNQFLINLKNDDLFDPQTIKEEIEIRFPKFKNKLLVS